MCIIIQISTLRISKVYYWRHWGAEIIDKSILICFLLVDCRLNLASGSYFIFIILIIYTLPFLRYIYRTVYHFNNLTLAQISCFFYRYQFTRLCLLKNLPLSMIRISLIHVRTSVMALTITCAFRDLTEVKLSKVLKKGGRGTAP